MKLALCIRQEDARDIPHVPNLSSFLQTRKDGTVLDCELNASFRQVIPYIVLLHKGCVLTYMRGRGGNETELHDEWSIGFGGHVETCPATSSYLDFARLMAEDARREVMEESGIVLTDANVESIEESVLGARWMLMLNGEATEVDKRHLGFVCCVELNDEQAASLASQEKTKIVDPHWHSLDDAGLLGYLESWSKTVWSEFFAIMNNFTAGCAEACDPKPLLVHTVTNAYAVTYSAK